MRPSVLLLVFAVAVVLGFTPESVWAQRGRGGGGGGGIRGGGGGGGGFSRPAAPSGMSRPASSPSYNAPQMSNRTPSMSRTAPSSAAGNFSQRPSAGQRPATADRPTAQRLQNHSSDDSPWAAVQSDDRLSLVAGRPRGAG
ncbi:MAG: hypothetical protein ACKO9H_12200, partial [Planctomycetota bacterium]